MKLEENDAVALLFNTKLHWIGETTVSLEKGVNKILDIIPEKICIAFDQSSTQTGIAISNAKGKIICVIDVINKGIPKESFIRMMRRWLYINFENQDIEYIICERAEQNAPQQYVKKLLHKLIDMLEDFSADMNVPCYQIDNKTWKKHYLKDSKFDGRRVKTELVKAAVVEKTCDLYPEMQGYYAISGAGTDSADAIGIMYGFSKECFVSGIGSTWKVCTLMPTYPLRKYHTEFMSLSEFRENMHNNPAYFKGVKVVQYNPSYTFEDNARKIINFFKNGAIMYTNDEKTRIGIWQNEADMKLDETSCVFVKYGK